MIGKRAFDYMAQESSSVSDLVVRGRFSTYLRNIVTLRNLAAKLDAFRFFIINDDCTDDGGLSD
jgi:hypothetical protein